MTQLFLVIWNVKVCLKHTACAHSVHNNGKAHFTTALPIHRYSESVNVYLIAFCLDYLHTHITLLVFEHQWVCTSFNIILSDQKCSNLHKYSNHKHNGTQCIRRLLFTYQNEMHRIWHIRLHLMETTLQTNKITTLFLCSWICQHVLQYSNDVLSLLANDIDNEICVYTCKTVDSAQQWFFFLSLFLCAIFSRLNCCALHSVHDFKSSLLEFDHKSLNTSVADVMQH